MLHRPRIPELAQRDRFVRRAVSEGRVLTFADEETASVASQKVRGKGVQLFWSNPIEATRWAEALAGNNALQEITLATFAADLLPGIAKAKGFVGTDWVSDPIEAEIDPVDLQLRLKAEAVPLFVKAAAKQGEVYIVGDDDGARLTPAGPWSGSEDLLQVFVSRSEAERHLQQAGGQLVVAESLSEFIGNTLAWAATRARAVAIQPIAGAGITEIKVADFGRQLAAAAGAK
ncbi:DUF2750 domain-containing protein [Hyphomicrobium sp.]|jgi:hypothetical protein|uniref:DUF2750 domain-containing protein n=1 Tax=Hyphomicrobium sp. TaxID=82 RepID=UPI002BBF90E7|nr:DUF2750 domain-containing protein [Hyphomicrobium sp.]HVZ03676.1 DUF2750 domain-containing protein [Hyphomicrobium sp.]